MNSVSQRKETELAEGTTDGGTAQIKTTIC